MRPITRLEAAKIKYQRNAYYKDLVDMLCAAMVEGNSTRPELEGALKLACDLRWKEAEEHLKEVERVYAAKGNGWETLMQSARRRFDRGVRDDMLFRDIMDTKL